MKKNDEIEVTIESLAYGGKGFTKVDNLALFVRNSLPGDRVLVKVIKKRSGFAEAIPIEFLERSRHYVDPECPHFKHCGGCTFQNLAYEEQLAQKETQVRDVLEHIGGVKNLDMDSIVPAPEVFYYRNKMEYSFSNKRWLTDDDESKPKDFALGLHVSGNYQKVLDIDDCRLQSVLSNRILSSIKKSAQKLKFKPYDVKNHSGNLRHLIIREAANTKDVLVNVVTKYNEPSKLKKIVDQLIKDCPEVTTVVNAVNEGVASIAYGTILNILHGTGSFKEVMVGVNLEIGAQEFLQTNTKAAELLYSKVLEYAEPEGGNVIYDLYSGVGSISIYLAPHAQRVTGFEMSLDAVESAGRNAVSNGVLNCNFISGDIRELFRDVESLSRTHGAPDIVVLDPPRGGIHPSIPKRLSSLKPKKIVYVSCNPASFARDVKLFNEKGYSLNRLQSFDLFPHTPHIELVSLLKPSE
ncbi:MAG: 23S rRNA (uracil(1939)-C(5))-methyltransferase RlmD [Candidatus Marinimicrobia bacterium]|nr:23S rRNA (uracil(1939)-C(5))-methyltransferase RlmD [Candidatus Neomarinimicrobiota bacterium]